MKTLSRNDFLLIASPRDPFAGAWEAYFQATSFLFTDGDTTTEPVSTFELNNIFFEQMHARLNRAYNPHLSRGISRSLLARPEEAKSSYYRPTLILKRLVSRSKLIEQHMYKNRERLLAARKSRALEDDPIEVLFSPLYFMRQYLTDPESTGSDAYAHAVIRAQIFADALKFDRQRTKQTSEDDKEEHPFRRIRELIRFERLVRSLQKIERHWKIGDNVAPANATDFIVMHILASRGYLILRLGKKNLKDRNEIRIDRSEFLKNKALTCPPKNNEEMAQEKGTSSGRSQPDFADDEEQSHAINPHLRNRTYEFRVLPEVARLPVAAELVSEIDGLPLPVPGCDVVLHRGLRFTEDSGVVARLSGRTGTGKTSVALGIAVALAPLGTRTVYLSCEEKPVDLEHRIQTLVPEHVRRLDVFQQLNSNWFSAEYVAGTPSEKYGKIQGFLNYINTEFSKHIKSRWETPPGTMPLFIVIDGVHELFSQHDKDSFGEQARELIEQCRNTGAFVLVLSAKSEQSVPDDLDYLVDFVAAVDFAPTKDSWERPVRTIIIQKTRRQASRVGTHVLHISGRQGLRIAPQVAAQLDQRRNFKWVEPTNNQIYDFLLRPQILGAQSSRPPVNSFLQVFDRSQILITGVGSGGKSVFGFKLLTTSLVSSDEMRRLSPLQTGGLKPLARAQNNLFDQASTLDEETDFGAADDSIDDIDLSSSWFERVMPNRRKFLVLSFLYEEDYYRKLWKRIAPYRRLDTLVRDRIPSVEFDVHSFSPGYLRPEDFLTIINQKLDRHELEGLPYDGVLIDGLHNVYLQFPYLEQSEMVWPMLFQMLRTRGLTVVTTHTYFSIDPGVYAQRLDADDVDSARRRAAPLLHALVQATDFRVLVSAEEHTKAEALRQLHNGQKFDTRIDVLGAIGQTVTSEPLYWDRERGVVMGLRHEDKAALSRR